MKEMITTVCLLKKDNEVLLAKKKRGFGEGKYNGVGGKVEPGETIEQCMIRETEEEITVTPTQYEYVGIIEFDEYFKDEPIKVTFHIYICTKWNGNITETEEMCPYWFNINEIPYDNMFADDIYWLPLILQGKKIKASFKFDKEWHIIAKNIEELNTLSKRYEKRP